MFTGLGRCPDTVPWHLPRSWGRSKWPPIWVSGHRVIWNRGCLVKSGKRPVQKLTSQRCSRQRGTCSFTLSPGLGGRTSTFHASRTLTVSKRLQAQTGAEGTHWGQTATESPGVYFKPTQSPKGFEAAAHTTCVWLPTVCGENNGRCEVFPSPLLPPHPWTGQAQHRATTLFGFRRPV